MNIETRRIPLLCSSLVLLICSACATTDPVRLTNANAVKEINVTSRNFLPECALPKPLTIKASDNPQLYQSLRHMVTPFFRNPSIDHSTSALNLKAATSFNVDGYNYVFHRRRLQPSGFELQMEKSLNGQSDTSAISFPVGMTVYAIKASAVYGSRIYLYLEYSKVQQGVQQGLWSFDTKSETFAEHGHPKVRGLSPVVQSYLAQNKLYLITHYGKSIYQFNIETEKWRGIPFSNNRFRKKHSYPSGANFGNGKVYFFDIVHDRTPPSSRLYEFDLMTETLKALTPNYPNVLPASAQIQSNRSTLFWGNHKATGVFFMFDLIFGELYRLNTRGAGYFDTTDDYLFIPTDQGLRIIDLDTYSIQTVALETQARSDRLDPLFFTDETDLVYSLRGGDFDTRRNFVMKLGCAK